MSSHNQATHARTTKSAPKTRSAPKAPAKSSAPKSPLQREGIRPGVEDASLDMRESRRSRDGHAFFDEARTRDGLAEDLGAGFVATITSGQDEGMEQRLDDEIQPEDGGPFIETSGDEEFGDDIDESNPEGATREPFPQTRSE